MRHTEKMEHTIRIFFKDNSSSVFPLIIPDSDFSRGVTGQFCALSGGSSQYRRNNQRFMAAGKDVSFFLLLTFVWSDHLNTYFG